jgi:hypothetical protein
MNPRVARNFEKAADGSASLVLRRMTERLLRECGEYWGKRSDVAKKSIFGLTFMVRGNMCCSVTKDELMLRRGAANQSACTGQRA